jgi:hypothetical protein
MTPKDNFRSCCVSNQGERRTGEVGSQGRDFLPWFHTRAQVECSVTDRVASFEPGLDWRPSCGTTDLSAGLVWNGRGLLAGCLRGSVVFLSLGLLSIKGRKRAKAFDGTGMGFHFPIEPSCLLTRGGDAHFCTHPSGTPSGQHALVYPLPNICEGCFLSAMVTASLAPGESEGL